MPSKGQSDYDAGWVYIARSKDLGKGKYKIGLSRNPKSRWKNLNKYGYAGSKKWYLPYMVPVSCMKCVESRVHNWLGEPFMPTEDATETEIREAPYWMARIRLSWIASKFKPRYPRKLWASRWR
jgi:hypothetical protein